MLRHIRAALSAKPALLILVLQLSNRQVRKYIVKFTYLIRNENWVRYPVSQNPESFFLHKHYN